MAIRSIKKRRVIKKLNKDKHIITVYRSNLNILAQVLEPKTLRPLCTFNSYKLKGNKTEQSIKVGDSLVEFLNKNKIEEVTFNRNGYLYHGRIKALAERVRELNIKF